MYHNEIPISRRWEYACLLSEAERRFGEIGNSEEAFHIVYKACAAVRDAENILSRIRYPLASNQQVVHLATLLAQSRRYVKNFWGSEEEMKAQAGVGQNEEATTIEKTPTPPPAPKRRQAQQPTVNEVQKTEEQATIYPKNVSPEDRQHLDQYLHTLSPKLQKQATMLHQKYAELNDAHETLDRLVRDHLGKPMTDSLSKQISFHAKKVDNKERTINAFWKRVQAEREALAGKEVTQAYQRHLQEEEAKYPMEEPLRTWGEYTKEEIEQMADDERLSEEGNYTLKALGCTIDDLVYARQERDKKLLRKKAQTPLSDDAREKRMVAIEELHEWGIPIHKKQLEMLNSLGIEVPEEYLNPFLVMTDEERLERKRENERRNSKAYYERNKPLAVKLNIERQMKKDKNADNPYTQPQLDFTDE